MSEPIPSTALALLSSLRLGGFRPSRRIQAAYDAWEAEEFPGLPNVADDSWRACTERGVQVWRRDAVTIRRAPSGGSQRVPTWSWDVACDDGATELTRTIHSTRPSSFEEAHAQAIRALEFSKVVPPTLAAGAAQGGWSSKSWGSAEVHRDLPISVAPRAPYTYIVTHDSIKVEGTTDSVADSRRAAFYWCLRLGLQVESKLPEGWRAVESVCAGWEYLPSDGAYAYITRTSATPTWEFEIRLKTSSTTKAWKSVAPIHKPNLMSMIGYVGARLDLLRAQDID